MVYPYFPCNMFGDFCWLGMLNKHHKNNEGIDLWCGIKQQKLQIQANKTWYLTLCDQQNLMTLTDTKGRMQQKGRYDQKEIDQKLAWTRRTRVFSVSKNVHEPTIVRKTLVYNDNRKQFPGLSKEADGSPLAIDNPFVCFCLLITCVVYIACSTSLCGSKVRPCELKWP